MKADAPGRGLSAPSSRRALTLGAAGAVIGLLVAGFSLFTAKGTRTAGVPPEDAALVNGTPILRVDLNDQLKSLYGVSLATAAPAQRRSVLDQMIREELLVQRGVEIGLPTDSTEVRTALVSGVEAQGAAETLMAAPSQDELRRWYDAHLDRFSSPGSMELQEWLAPDDAKAQTALAALRGGRDPASADARRSPRMADGAEFYFAARIHLGDALFQRAQAMKDGEAVIAGRDAQGIHILRMAHNEPPEPTPWPQAGPEVLADLVKARTAEVQAVEAQFLRKRAQIKLAGDLR